MPQPPKVPIFIYNQDQPCKFSLFKSTPIWLHLHAIYSDPQWRWKLIGNFILIFNSYLIKNIKLLLWLNPSLELFIKKLLGRKNMILSDLEAHTF